MWQTRTCGSVVRGKCVCMVFVLNTREIAITHGQICMCPRIKNHTSVKLEVDCTVTKMIKIKNIKESRD